jgi:hypothetical protein
VADRGVAIDPTAERIAERLVSDALTRYSSVILQLGTVARRAHAGKRVHVFTPHSLRPSIQAIHRLFGFPFSVLFFFSKPPISTEDWTTKLVPTPPRTQAHPTTTGLVFCIALTKHG